ncbi:MAG: hypothetical protein KAH77_01010 [Thiomargarita sp.]|nr:hypothetical protein [Thiomargarita sp.]
MSELRFLLIPFAIFAVIFTPVIIVAVNIIALAGLIIYPVLHWAMGGFHTTKHHAA